jgi:hypothetical protein
MLYASSQRKLIGSLVVKLFNAIQQSQAAAAIADEEAKASRGTGKPALPAPTVDRIPKRKGKQKDNLIGRGKQSSSFVTSLQPQF